MHNLRRFTQSLLVITFTATSLASLSGLSGCAAALVGGAVMGAMSVSDRRTIGAQTEDTAIEFKAANRLSVVFGDTVHVNVTSYNRKVLLTGEVKDEATKARVEEEIKLIPNVQSVVNEIQLSAFTSGFGSRSTDTLLSTKVKSTLLGTSDIYSSSFKVVTENGVVYLMGRVSQREGNTAAEAAREVSGVQKVVKVFDYIDENEVKSYEAPPLEVNTTPN